MRRVARPFALVRIDGRLTLAEVTSIASEGGFPIGGPITGYRVRPMTDEGRIINPSADPVWVRPVDFIRDWAIRPSAVNLDKAIDAARRTA